MRVLVDTELAGMFSVLSVDDKAEIAMCMFNYPDRDCDLPMWQYIKKQIERDQTAYQNRCRGLSDARRNRWAKQSEQIENQSDDFAAAPSDAMCNNNPNINHNDNGNNKARADALIHGFAGSFNPNADKKYDISHDFSFIELLRREPHLAQILSDYPEIVLIRAGRALADKCAGKRLTFAAIMKWVEEQNKHHK